MKMIDSFISLLRAFLIIGTFFFLHTVHNVYISFKEKRWTRNYIGCTEKLEQIQFVCFNCILIMKIIRFTTNFFGMCLEMDKILERGSIYVTINEHFG